MPAGDSCVHKVRRKIAYELLLELGRNAELICEVVVKLHLEQSPRYCQCSTKMFMTTLFITKVEVTKVAVCRRMDKLWSIHTKSCLSMR